MRVSLKAELDRLEKLNVIGKIEKPTEWVSHVVIVQKPNGKVGLCLDSKPLNDALKRSHYSIPTFR
jgi:hypothetical protein